MWRNHRGHSTEGPEEIQIARPRSSVMRRSTNMANVGSLEISSRAGANHFALRQRHAVPAERRCHEQRLVGRYCGSDSEDESVMIGGCRPSFSPSRCLSGCHREAHRPHKAHFIDLFSGMDFHLVSARLPAALRRRQLQIPRFILQCDVHGILPDDRVRIESWNGFRVTPAEHLKGLIVLVQREHDEDAGGIWAESFSRFEGDNFMGPAVTQLFLETLRHRDASEEALRRRIEVVGLGVFRTVLEVVDRRVLEDWEFLCKQDTAPTARGESQYYGHGAHAALIGTGEHSKFRTPETEGSQALG